MSRADIPPKTRWHSSEAAYLEREYQDPAEGPRALLVKVDWWSTVPVALGPEFGNQCEVKRGATMVLDDQGRLMAVIKGAPPGEMDERRGLFLKRLAANGAMLPPSQEIGPDGKPLSGFVNATVVDSRLRVSGGFRSLHLAEAGG
jgi:hypothetical protein